MYLAGSSVFIGKDVCNYDNDPIMDQVMLDTIIASDWLHVIAWKPKKIEPSKATSFIQIALGALLLIEGSLGEDYSAIMESFLFRDNSQYNIPQLVQKYFDHFRDYQKRAADFHSLDFKQSNTFNRNVSSAIQKLGKADKIFYLTSDITISTQFNTQLVEDPMVQLFQVFQQMVNSIAQNILIGATTIKLAGDVLESYLGELMQQISSALAGITSKLGSLEAVKDFFTQLFILFGLLSDPALPAMLGKTTYTTQVDVTVRLYANTMANFPENVFVPLLSMFAICTPRNLRAELLDTNVQNKYLKAVFELLAKTSLSAIFPTSPPILSVIVPGKVYIPFAAPRSFSINISDESFTSGHPKYVDVQMTFVDLLPIVVFASNPNISAPSYNPLFGGPVNSLTDTKKQIIKKLKQLDESKITEENKVVLPSHVLFKLPLR